MLGPDSNGTPIKIYREKASRAKTDRPELAKLLRALEPGDVLIVKRLEILREVLPALRRLAVIANVGYRAAALEMDEVQRAGRTLNIDSRFTPNCGLTKCDAGTALSCQFQPRAGQQKTSLFDHFVGLGQQCR